MLKGGTLIALNRYHQQEHQGERRKRRSPGRRGRQHNMGKPSALVTGVAVAVAALMLATSCQSVVGMAQKQQEQPYYSYYTSYNTYNSVPAKPPTPPPAKKNEDEEGRRRLMVAVQGVVMCHNCSHGTAQSLADSTPIVGATVAVVCKDEQERSVYYGTEKTRSKGYFYHLILDDEGVMYDPSVSDPADFCEVHLVESPLEDCNHFTNINQGISGGLLHLERSFSHGNVKVLLYSSGPFAFSAPLDKCPYPSSHHS